jgi:hypothetical protein
MTSMNHCGFSFFWQEDHDGDAKIITQKNTEPTHGSASSCAVSIVLAVLLNLMLFSH